MSTRIRRPGRTASLEAVADRILALRARVPRRRAVLAAISGIDGSGKGYTTARLEARLAALGHRVVNVNIDGWLRLPAERFDPARPAEHFYERGIRFDELFERLVLPLVRDRSIRLQADLADATANATFTPFTYAFDDVDIVLLEGIFLLRAEWLPRYDLSVWIDCGFDTALERALARGQEHLSAEETVRDYHTIYFPAQRIHLERDDPRGRADLVVPNDPRA